ncbi:hypothetical protein [Stanieria cyanosphaera]|nr:hypothetical protein [Stanieria cyanosphaera]
MKIRNLLISFSLGLLLPLIAIDFSANHSLTLVVAQNLRPEMAAAEVYQRLKQFPPANQYLSQETGKIDSDNTLVSRIIRYHQYVKSRPVTYRLDWQLTLADYLGVNEPISESRYPGSQTLTVNPQQSDIKIIKDLTRTQRNKLIETLVSIYNPQTPSTNNSNSSPPSPSSNSVSQPRLPQPGDAQLLLP